MPLIFWKHSKVWPWSVHGGKKQVCLEFIFLNGVVYYFKTYYTHLRKHVMHFNVYYVTLLTVTKDILVHLPFLLSLAWIFQWVWSAVQTASSSLQHLQVHIVKVNGYLMVLTLMNIIMTTLILLVSTKLTMFIGPLIRTFSSPQERRNKTHSVSTKTM